MNMYLSECIAKTSSNQALQTFEGHTIDCLIILKDYLIKNRDVLERFSDNYNIDLNTLSNLMFLSVFIHDLGKLTEEFQQKIVTAGHCGYFSHSFFGLPFINSNLPDYLNNLLKLLVVSHHTQLYTRIYEDANLSLKVNYLNKDIELWISSANDVYSRYLYGLFDINYRPIYVYEDYLSKPEMNESIRNAIRELKRLQTSKNKNIRTKAIYSLCLSVLKHCDQKASAHFSNLNLERGKYGSVITDSSISLNQINYNPTDVFNLELDSFFGSKKIQAPIELYKFQKELADTNKSTIISAPCGRGKTEGALLGAINIVKQQKKNRIIFALPTQITSNSMYERLKKIFGNDNVGLYHGMSRYHHYDADDFKDEEDIRNLIYDEKVFEKPVTITTIDHLIYSLVHGYKQADFALGNILNSVIILDEIHYYENHTLRYILDCLRILRDLKIPYIAMSGTLPSFIVEELNKIQQHALIEDDEGSNLMPFIIEKRSSFIVDARDEIKNIYINGKSQIVIVNTVTRAKEMYHLLEKDMPKDDLFLLHSQLTFYDRSKKEKTISALGNGPWILVSTQAIEISVDISCDIMHTEMAPIDSIGQRGGRLNRGGKNHNNEHFMYLYEPKDHLPYFSEHDEIDIVERTNNVIENSSISYAIIKQWCDKVYSDIKLRPQNLENVFKKCILFGYSPKEIRYSEDDGNLVEVRNIKDITVDVIPEKYWFDIRFCPKEIDRFKVKVPKWWYSRYGKDHFYISESSNGRRYIISTIEYSPEFGFDIESICEDKRSCIII